MLWNQQLMFEASKGQTIVQHSKNDRIPDTMASPLLLRTRYSQCSAIQQRIHPSCLLQSSRLMHVSAEEYDMISIISQKVANVVSTAEFFGSSSVLGANVARNQRTNDLSSSETYVKKTLRCTRTPCDRLASMLAALVASTQRTTWPSRTRTRG